MGPVELTVDLMSVNRIPCVLTLGKRVKFTTIDNDPDRKVLTLLRGLMAVHNIYGERGHTVSTIYSTVYSMDNIFKVFSNNMKGFQIAGLT